MDLFNKLAKHWLLAVSGFLTLVCFALVAILVAKDPLATGGDEGMELAKALLLLRTPGQAATEWTDQPWFYSQVFAGVFRGSVTIARLATATVGVGMFALWMTLVKRHSGLALSFLLPPLVCALPFTLQCFAACMCEIPAYGLAVSALGVLLLSRPSVLWRGLLAGILFGLAVNVKLTAAMLVPSILIAMLWDHDKCWFSITMLRQTAVPFCISAGLITAAACLWSPRFSWSLLWQSHAMAAANGGATVRGYHAKVADVIPYFSLVVPTLVGAISGLFNPKSRQLAMSQVVAFATAIAVHSWHVPYWEFYDIHFGFPIAVLSILGLAWLGQQIRLCLGDVEYSPRFPRILAGVLLLFIASASWACSYDIHRPFSQWVDCLKYPKTTDSKLVKYLREATFPEWHCYSRNNVIIARAGLLQLPDLTILSFKRLWSSSITEKEIIQKVDKARVEVLMLSELHEMHKDEWRSVLTNRYSLGIQEGDLMIFVRSDLKLKEHNIIDAKGVIKSLGL